jgi:putative chitinase
MIRVSTTDLLSITPTMATSVREAFSCADAGLAPFGINATPLRLAHFLAQAAHETAGFTKLTESLMYTTAARIVAVWPSRFRTIDSAQPFVRQPRKLANMVYGGRMENDGPDDGWLFRGRGIFHLTGKANYREAGTALDLDLVSHPEWVIVPEYLLPVAGVFWRSRGCNRVADADNLLEVTKRINGGTHGYPDRARWLNRFKDLFEVA